jgi:hypothetical protein
LWQASEPGFSRWIVIHRGEDSGALFLPSFPLLKQIRACFQIVSYGFLRCWDDFGRARRQRPPHAWLFLAFPSSLPGTPDAKHSPMPPKHLSTAVKRLVAPFTHPDHALLLELASGALLIAWMVHWSVE